MGAGSSKTDESSETDEQEVRRMSRKVAASSSRRHPGRQPRPAPQVLTSPSSPSVCYLFLYFPKKDPKTLFPPLICPMGLDLMPGAVREQKEGG
jgi:hypothetical protein